VNKIKSIGLFLLATLQAGCAAVVLAGAASGYIIYDDRSVRTLEKDGRIFHVVHKALVRTPELSNAHINVTSFKQAVLLTGEAPYASQRALAEKFARNAPNVRRIYNEITIGQPSSMWQRTQDSGITSNVKTHMLAKKDLESGAIHIITENGIVYLMGDVTHAQGDLAVNVARDIPGVYKVVKVFQYVDG